MDKTTTKASFSLVLIFLTAFLGTIGSTEGSRNVPKKDHDELYNPQNFFGFPGGFGSFNGGPGFSGFPGMGFHGSFGPFGGIPGFGGPGKGDGPSPKATINGVGGKSPKADVGIKTDCEKGEPM
ncbi:keratin, type II cytoskeletal 2 epidermal-like [Carya illinoinensis]|uniref:keratin, type II cytoskeletal 2 epidermal-like n=1 Tax=Carya illinoinensis TaxID=32201 RepID=UPI001C723C22|nr:keratin, type II cytoskeletal 2 epidermal-like [Carya illinoinensis]